VGKVDLRPYLCEKDVFTVSPRFETKQLQKTFRQNVFKMQTPRPLGPEDKTTTQSNRAATVPGIKHRLFHVPTPVLP